MSYVNNAAIKKSIKEKDMESTGDFVEAVNAKVTDLLAVAVKRAQDNGRKTVMPRDL